MKYNDLSYKDFMEKVKNKRYLVSELELRKEMSTNVLISVMGTGKAWNYTDGYPVEVFQSYDIVIEYVDTEDVSFKNGKPKFLSECIEFDCDVKSDVVMPVYEELLKRRVSK